MYVSVFVFSMINVFCTIMWQRFLVCFFALITGTRLSEGCACQCVVLYIDLSQECVEVTFNREFVMDAVKSKKVKVKKKVGLV